MSIVCTVYLSEGIIMAADSRITGVNIGPDENGLVVKNTFTRSDNGQKVFLLEKAKVGINICGAMEINGQPAFDFIREFEINDIEEDNSPKTVAEKLSKRLGDWIDTVFTVSGYYEDIPYVYEVLGKRITRFNYEGDEIQYGYMWSGQKDAMTKLMNGDPPCIINCYFMPLKDGIDFAEFIIDTTIKYERFYDSIQTCGGPIDILVLTKDEAFWHKHKIYKSS